MQLRAVTVSLGLLRGRLLSFTNFRAIGYQGKIDVEAKLYSVNEEDFQV